MSVLARQCLHVGSWRQSVQKMCFDRRTGVATTIYLPLIIRKQRMADFLVLCGLFSAMYAIFNHFHHFSSRSWGCSIRLNNTGQSDGLVSRWGSMTEKHMSYVHLEYRRSHMLQPNKSFHNVSLSVFLFNVTMVYHVIVSNYMFL